MLLGLGGWRRVSGNAAVLALALEITPSGTRSLRIEKRAGRLLLLRDHHRRGGSVTVILRKLYASLGLVEWPRILVECPRILVNDRHGSVRDVSLWERKKPGVPSLSLSL